MFKHFSKLLLVSSLLLRTDMAFAQYSPFCTSGLQPDGFVDWSKLPPPLPPLTNVNVTIPVRGVPGLTATLQISPGGTFAQGPDFSRTAFYSTVNSTNISVPSGVIPTITFNKPVKGVSVVIQSGGRFGYGYGITAYNNVGQATAVPPVDEVTEGGFQRGVKVFNSLPFEIRSQNTDISYVVFNLGMGSPIEGYDTFDLTNLRVESGSAPDPALSIPMAGMREWLRADKISLAGDAIPGSPEGAIQYDGSWPDQSGHGSDAVLIAPKTFFNATTAGPNCNAAVVGGGPLTFNLPINGWTGMTVFMATQATWDAGGWWENQALMWPETEPWGTTFFSPSQTNVFFRFGTGQVENQPIRPRVSDIGGDFTVTTAVHDGTTDSLWVNGQLALQQGGKQAVIQGTSPNALIGVGLLGTTFAGNIGEIIIYDRALTDAERETVQHYLTAKYGTH